jgi:hypothetical protein
MTGISISALFFCCTRCGEKKQETRDFFGRSTRRASGLHSVCIVCEVARRKEWHSANRPKALLMMKEYRASHLDKVTAYIHGWNVANKEHVRVQRASHRAKNRVALAARDHSRYVCNKAKRLDQIKSAKSRKKEYYAAKTQVYYNNNKSKILAKQLSWYIANKKQVSVKRRLYAASHIDQKNAYSRVWKKSLRASCPGVRVNEAMSRRIRSSIRSGKNGAHWEHLVGYTASILMRHLERQFTKGMSWNNYGKWHIDHRVPIVSFQIESIECPEFRACWALSNLQPLWAPLNMAKGGKRIFLL